MPVHNKHFIAGFRLLIDVLVGTVIFLAITLVVLAGGTGLEAMIAYFGADAFTGAFLKGVKGFTLVVDGICYLWWIVASAIRFAKSI